MPLFNAQGLAAPNRLLLDSTVWMAATIGASGVITDELLLILETAAHDGRLSVSALTVWELALLARHGLLDFGDFPSWLADQTRPPGVTVLPVTAELAYHCTQLSGWKDGDGGGAPPLEIPAYDAVDRFLVAAARQGGMVLVTTDPALLSYAARGGCAAYDARA